MIYFLGDEPVTIVGRENAREVWVEKENGTILRVWKRGLAEAAPMMGHGNVKLTIDNTRGTDGAR